jgi:hypothetical protein
MKASKANDDRPELAKELCEKLQGRFIPREEAQALMDSAEYSRTKSAFSDQAEDLQILVDGRYLAIRRTDLCGEAPTSVYSVDGSHLNWRRWRDAVYFGAIVCPDSFFVIDSWSDG